MVFAVSRWHRTLRPLLMACAAVAAGSVARAQWQDVGSLDDGGIYGLCTLGDTLYAASSSGGVYASADRGAHWVSRSNGLTNKNVRTVVAHNAFLVAGTLGGGVFTSSNRGESWGSAGLGGLFVQALLSTGEILLAGTDRGIFRSSNSGASWSEANVGLTNLTVTALAASGGRFFAGTFGTGVFISNDLGSAWQWISSGLNSPYILSLTVAGNIVHAGTMGGGVFAFSDTSGRWEHSSVGLSGLNVNAFLGFPRQVLAGTNTGRVYSSAAGWTPEDIIQQEVREPGSYNYLLFMPRNRSEENSGLLPLIIFLHGIDGRDGALGGSSDLQKLKKEGLPKILDGKNEFPAIVVSPQCPSVTEWYYENVDNNRLLNRLLDSVIQRYPVDTSRIYITGLSMGGIGSWYFAIHNPSRFAAIVPVAARGEPTWNVCAIRDSVWAFHGALDGTVPLPAAEAIVNALRACGGIPRFTVYPDVGHDSWTITYSRQDLYDWLFLQRKQ